MNTRRLLMAMAILIGWAIQGSAVGQYLFQPGDNIQISVWQEPRLDRQIAVAPDGTIALPLVGRIQAGGRTADQVQAAIAARLAPQYETELDVTVHPLTPEDKIDPTIYVTGQVSRPGQFPVETPTTILQALALSGGLSPFAADRRIQVHRKLAGQEKLYIFNYRAFERGENLSSNILLRPGDVIVVPERGLLE